MYTPSDICQYTALIVLGLVLALPVSGQEQLRITSDSAGIFIAPDSTQTLVARAEKGEVFEPAGYEDGWVGIHMFSGEIRYVRERDTKPVYELAGQHIASASKHEICADIHKGQ